MNTSFLFVVVLIFVSAVYFTNPQIGGISGMFEKLTAAAASRPIDGNAAGSYLTLASTGALIFGVVNIVGNFGTVFVDQAYWQRAIAAGPRAAFRGFLIGGMAWFAIPFALATTLGLAAVAINLNLTPQEISMGLVAPNAAYSILGDVGAILILAILFTAVTSAGSAELVAVSSLVTYDVYRTYTKPSSTGRELMRISRLSIVIFGMGMGVLALILLQIGVSLQYIYLAMGILIGSAVVPVALAVMWNKTNKNAATVGAIAGLACGLAFWFGTAYQMAGEITINSTSHEVPLLVGNITSILVGAAVVLLGSKIRPEHFDFDLMKQKIVMVDGRIRELFGNDNEEYLRKSSRVGYKVAIALTLIMVVAWPMPLYLSGYVFSEGTYFLWIGIAVAWASVAAAVIIFMPLIESRAGILQAIHIIKTETSAKAGDLARENRWPEYSGAKDSELPSKKILVAIDGSRQSLHALNYAMGLYNDPGPSRVFLLHVIEWAEETEEPLDEEMTTKMEKEGRLLLNSLVMPKLSNQIVKIIKVGDPATKITEVADSIGASVIVMGSSGLGNSEELGNVTRKVLKLASRPVVLMK
jgi:Na+/proline symporter/nucleotide-binding universal stress UspA family protein